MEPLLFLSHRLPYPPNKGDKVRSWNFLRHLASRYRVFLGTFIDDPADREHVDTLRRVCAGVHVETLLPWARRASSASALWRGEPLSLAYFRSRALQQWVGRTAQEQGIGRAFAFSSPMAQYVLDLQLRTIVDFVDMDSAKWADYAARRSWPASALFGREARRLFAYERQVAAGAEASIFVTEEETRRFLGQARQGLQRVVTIRNGVDSEQFSPQASFVSPFPADEQPIVFTGAMDYWPNVDAVIWFAREVLPQLRRRNPALRFYVVGMNPDVPVRALTSDGGTIVTGRVPDVRPYLQHARVVVAPLRVARGIQNKVLEAMAMAKPVVVTPSCAAGLSAREGVELAVAAGAADFAARVSELLDAAKAAAMGRAARERVLVDYAWPASFAQLDRVMEGVLPAPLAAAG